MAIVRVRKGKFPGRVHAIFDSVKPTLIGRDATAHVNLEDERASRKHARILRAYGGWLLQDLGSSNGTYVDRERVEKTGLRSEATIQIGSTLLSFHDDEWPPPPGEEVYGTRLMEVFGEEGGVLVHKGFQAAMDREVRVDKIATGWRLSASVRESIQRAFAEAAKVDHPSLQPLIHGVIRGDGGYAIIRSRGGEPLSGLFEELIRQPLGVRLSVFRQLVDALMARAVWENLRSPIGLHQVMVEKREDGSFNISLPAVELRALVTERTGGLPHLPTYVPYLPPELAGKGEPACPIGFTSTMYLLGAIGYHLMTGNLPMGEGPVRKVLENHQQLEPAPASLVCSEVPETLSGLLSRMLAKDPTQRPTGRMEIVRVLDELKIEVPSAPEPTVSSPPPTHESTAARNPAAPARAPSEISARRSEGEEKRPRAAGRSRRVRVGFLGSVLSAPLWIGFWVALFLSARILVKKLLLGEF